MKFKILLLTALLLSDVAFAQGPGGLGISLVTDGTTTVTSTRQMVFTCGADVTSGGTGTGIANVAAGPVISLTKTSDYTIPSTQCGYAYNNIGATGTVIFTLPAAAAGLHYYFTVDAAQTVEVLGAGTDQIAIGASNSSSQNVTAAAAYASLHLYAYKTGQWVALASTGTWTVH